MAQATAVIIQKYGAGFGESVKEKLPKTAAQIWQGAYCGITSGDLRQLVATDEFHGIALQSRDATQLEIMVVEEGTIDVAVAAGGVLANSKADRGLPVYVNDSTTLTGLITGSTLFGKIVKWLSSGVYRVHFQALPRR